MVRITTTPGPPIRVALVSALLVSLPSLASVPAATAQRPARMVGAARHAVALPSGLAPVLARALRHGTNAPSVAPTWPWSQQAEFTASDGNQLGWSVALSSDGTTALIGTPYKNSNTGAAYVFVRSGTSWSQQAEITATDGSNGDYFGYSVALLGNTALIGAYNETVNGNGGAGAAYMFVRSGTTWSQQAEITASDAGQSDEFGSSVALGGPIVLGGITALIGAPGKNNGTGAAYVYVGSGATWRPWAELTARDSTGNDRFGFSVTLNGTTALIGDPYKNNYTGAAYMFVPSGLTWSQQAEITATDGMAGDFFGYTVALSGTTTLIGAPDRRNDTGAQAGAAYVFVSSGSNWSQQAEFTASDGVSGDNFGHSVALWGSTALIGAPYKYNGTGAAYVFVRGGTRWSQQAELNPTDGPGNYQFGFAVALGNGGNTALIGAPNKNSTGAAYTFARPAIVLLPSAGKVGTRVTLVGTGFAANEQVAALWSKNPGVSVLGSATSNVTGTVVVPFTVPASAVGTHVVIGYGLSTFGELAFAPFAVTASSSEAISSAQGRAVAAPNSVKR